MPEKVVVLTPAAEAAEVARMSASVLIDLIIITISLQGLELHAQFYRLSAECFGVLLPGIFKPLHQHFLFSIFLIQV